MYIKTTKEFCKLLVCSLVVVLRLEASIPTLPIKKEKKGSFFLFFLVFFKLKTKITEGQYL